MADNKEVWTGANYDEYVEGTDNIKKYSQVVFGWQDCYAEVVIEEHSEDVAPRHKFTGYFLFDTKHKGQPTAFKSLADAADFFYKHLGCVHDSLSVALGVQKSDQLARYA